MVVEFYIDKSLRKNATQKLSSLTLDETKSKNIERGIYDFSSKYCVRNGIIHTHYELIYTDKLNSVIYDIGSHTIPENDLLEKIINDKIDCYRIAFMKPHELQPKCWEKRNQTFRINSISQ